MALIFNFIDGLGIGPGAGYNPLSQRTWEGLEFFSGSPLYKERFEERVKNGQVVKSADARLEVEGLPQSGTGQTTLFSGHNAAKYLGRHHGPFPHSKIKPFLGEPSMFGQARKQGYRCHFMNAYPDRFFEMAEKRNRWSCTTKMCIENGIRLNREEDVWNDRAITAEIYQDVWRKRLGIDLPDIDEYRAAQRLSAAAAEHDFLLYEYYLTDKAGHAMDPVEAAEALNRIDRLLQAVAGVIDFQQHLLLICSDHGNVEDLSGKTHTLNPVPLMAYGIGADEFKSVNTLTEVTPAIINWLSRYGNRAPS